MCWPHLPVFSHLFKKAECPSAWPVLSPGACVSLLPLDLWTPRRHLPLPIPSLLLLTAVRLLLLHYLKTLVLKVFNKPFSFLTYFSQLFYLKTFQKLAIIAYFLTLPSVISVNPCVFPLSLVGSWVLAGVFFSTSCPPKIVIP